MSKIDLEKKFYYYNLFLMYHQLLTKKQQFYFNSYFSHDLSLEEIANNCNVSRNAIFDSLSKTIKTLIYYETKLKLYEKYKLRHKIYQSHQEFDFIKKLQAIDNTDTEILEEK